MTALTATGTRDTAVTDDHSLLLWQICAYADELTDAVRAGQAFAAPYDALVDFLHQRLLPYLNQEERRLPPGQLRDDHLAALIRSEHARLRADVDNIEGSRTRSVLALATESLVDRLERHVHREEVWVRRSDDLRVERDSAIGAAPRGSAWV